MHPQCIYCYEIHCHIYNKGLQLYNVAMALSSLETSTGRTVFIEHVVGRL